MVRGLEAAGHEVVRARQPVSANTIATSAARKVEAVTAAAARETGLPEGLPVTAGTVDAWAALGDAMLAAGAAGVDVSGWNPDDHVVHPSGDGVRDRYDDF